MKPAPFDYVAPSTIEEAVAALAAADGDAKVLAGGQSLIPILALRLSRFDRLVDLRLVDSLQGAERANGTLRIGAMTATGGPGARRVGCRGRAAARPRAAVDRPLPDPQPRHHRRIDRPRRPGR